MDGFRQFIIGIAEFCQIIFIIAWTIFGGYAGYTYAQILHFSPAIGRPEMYIGDMPARDVFIILFGALSGFVFAATLAAILFTFAQIEKNTRVAKGSFADMDHEADPIARRVMPHL